MTSVILEKKMTDVFCIACLHLYLMKVQCFVPKETMKSITANTRIEKYAYRH